MLAADELIAKAVAKTGLEDFGGDDWREGFDRLIAALNDEADLTDLGARVTAFRVRRLLENRLRIEQTYRENPAIDDERIEAPIFIIGLPRTGTTALSNLIASDPQIRSLRLWESSEPVPPPTTDTERTDPRIATTQAGLDAMDQVYPRMKALYPQSATGPTECQDLLGMAFGTIHFDGMARVPSYISWVVDADMAPAYEYHRRTLKLLQWRCPPKQWHLKTPAHTLALDALNDVYPDARFIWTHRDPAEVIGSVCSLITYLRAMVSDRTDPNELGERQLALWMEAVRRAMAFRDRVGEERFADVRNEDLGPNPIGAMRAAYEKLGLAFTSRCEDAMRAYADANPRNAHGKHEYELEDFGLDAATVRWRFDEYLQRFG